jgi:hypothetical protein
MAIARIFQSGLENHLSAHKPDAPWSWRCRSLWCAHCAHFLRALCAPSPCEGCWQLGCELHKAKADLEKEVGGHGQWQRLVESDLKFNPFVARMFMRIATWIENVGNAYVLKRLPPDYTTIDKITRLDAATFKRLGRRYGSL